MVIVAGHIVVDWEQRKSYLVGCKAVVEQARSSPGCLDFAVTADLVDPGRIDIFERWETQAAVEAFRGSGSQRGAERGDALRLGCGVRRRGRALPHLRANLNFSAIQASWPTGESVSA